MADQLTKDSIGQLFETVLQHAKCIEVRIDYARALTSQKQKYVLGNVVNKARGIINHMCDLLPDTDSVLRVKQELDKSDLVYVMLLTEQLTKIKSEDLEEVVEMIDEYLLKKYGPSENK